MPSAPLSTPELALESRVRPEVPDVVPAPDWPNLALTPEPEPTLPSVVDVPTDPLPLPPLRPPEVTAAAVVSVPEAIEPPAMRVEAPELTLTTSIPPPAPVVPTAAVRPPPPPTPAPARVAQEIQRAKAPAETQRRPTRLIVLGAIAVFLALGFFSVFSGWWGDPMRWFVPNSQNTLIEPDTLPIDEPPAELAPELAPAVAPPVVNEIDSDQPKSTTSKEKIVPKPVARSLAPAKEEIIEPTAKAVQEKEAKVAAKKEAPSIQRRSVGPSALEQGYSALTEGRLKEASQAYMQALAINPEERDALLGLAYIAHQQGREDEASAYYKRVLRQDPSNAVAQAGLIALEARVDRQDSASRARDVAEQNPQSAAAQAMLGHSLVQENRLADAQQAFYQAHLLEPAVASHAFNLAVALDRMRNYVSAQRYYEMALSLSIQSGGERASHVPHAAVQTRLDQLRSPPATDPASTLTR